MKLTLDELETLVHNRLKHAIQKRKDIQALGTFGVNTGPADLKTAIDQLEESYKALIVELKR